MTPVAKRGLPSPEIGNCVLTAVKAPSCPMNKLCCLLLISELVAEVGFSYDYHQIMITEVTIPWVLLGRGFPLVLPPFSLPHSLLAV